MITFTHFFNRVLASHICIKLVKQILLLAAALLERFWRISLNVTDDAIAKLYVT